MNTAKPNKLAIIAITPQGLRQARVLKAAFTCDCYTSDKLVDEGFMGFEGSMAACIARIFKDYDTLVFICATGIVVRMIAPLIMDKFYDPAVLVMDERAQFVISLLSGHVGGANAIAQEMSTVMGATPVITTATDVNGVAALDLIIQAVGASLEAHRDDIKRVNQALVSGHKVGLYCAHVSIENTQGFLKLTQLTDIPQDLALLVVISPKSAAIEAPCPVIKITPKVVVLGMGCKRNTPFETLYRNVTEHMAHYGLSLEAIKVLGSVSLKADEAGLIALSQQLNIPFKTFSVAALKEQEHRFEGSEFVCQTLGVSCVSQPCAWLLSQGHLIGETLKREGLTLTLGIKE